MKAQTEKRIKFYQAALPGMKEKVLAACMMLFIALLTAVSATYAWVTLSRAPQVSGVTTTLSGNGNLEIALSDDDGLEPDEFDVDEGVSSSVNIVASNLQWGNLINLSDPTYGMDQYTLRPAELNDGMLTTKPLRGVKYGEDGRITSKTNDFVFAKYNKTGGAFDVANNSYGVRAIASYVTGQSVGAQVELNERIEKVSNKREAVYQEYAKAIESFEGLGRMISRFAQDKVNKSDYKPSGSQYDVTDSSMSPYLGDMLNLYHAVQATMEKQQDVYVELANLQLFLWSKQEEGRTFSEITWEELKSKHADYSAADLNSSSKNGIISLTGFSTFVKDQETLNRDTEKLEEYKTAYDTDKTNYYWSHGGDNGFQINQMITRLIDYGTMYMILGGKAVPVVNIQSLGADLLSYNKTTQSVYIKNGILKRMEQTVIDAGYRMNGNAKCNIAITVEKIVIVNFKIFGKAYTVEDEGTDSTKWTGKQLGNSWLQQDFAKAQQTELGNVDKTPQDIYGMAIDFWVRTNTEQTYLTLEGAVATDENGNILSYDGVNRIWGKTGKTVLTTDSTTQGGGSCYIYYADTPEDQERSLKLLDSIKVAFIDANGNKLATAGMDTVNYYAVNGRVTVPLVLDVDSPTTYEYTDEQNITRVGRAIQQLTYDSASRITAILYLEGIRLTNDQVLAASEIQGQLNIQFGSSDDLKTLGNNDLMDDTRSVTAEIDQTTFDYDSALTTDDLKAHVTLHVFGTEPTETTAFFLRAINSTQGSREETMSFTKQADGTWTTDYVFTAPGTYYLRHVRLDGVDYALAEPIKVEVKGFALKSVSWSEAGNSAKIQTSEQTYSEKLTVEFATSDILKMPVSVNACFKRQDGNILNVPLRCGSDGKWTGKAEFVMSGTYTLEYLIYKTSLDKNGIYRDLVHDGFSKTIELALGMYVKIQDQSGGLIEKFESGKTYSKDVIVKIYDNSGKEQMGLTDITLVYSNGGSATNTVPAVLTWNDLQEQYEGTFPFVTAGRFQFLELRMNGQALSRASESPVYTIISPDPPIFDTASQSSYYGEIQFAPLSNDAVIDMIKIRNAESATISAVVYNDRSKQYYVVDAEGVKFSGNAWSIALPKYTNNVGSDGKPLENAEYTQDGTWKLILLKLENCYDANGEFRGEDHPLYWIGSDAESKKYAQNLVDDTGNSFADETIDFSKLSTTVSCSVKVQMISGTTALGGTTTKFMQRFQTNRIGMKVLLTDEAGNVIPAKKVAGVILKVNYIAPTASSQYGYKVQAEANRTYEIELDEQDAEDGYREVSSGDVWQYAGEYRVESLQVSIGGKTLTYTAEDKIGVPSMYTLTTQKYRTDNISLADENIQQRKTVLGKTGENVTSTFLQKEGLGITAKITLTTEDGSDTSKVILENVSAEVQLIYQNGKTAPNGGYSWNTESPYEKITVKMNAIGAVYETEETPLLAGTYKAVLLASVDGEKKEKELKNISAYSKAPAVKITGVSPSVQTLYRFNTNLSAKYFSEAELMQVQNYLSADNLLANVYIAAEEWVQTIDEKEIGYIRYSLPKVQLTISEAGTTYSSATAFVPNGTDGQYGTTYQFLQTAKTVSAEIGGREEKVGLNSGGMCGEDVEEKWEMQYPAGEQTIKTLQMKADGDTVYTVTIASPITIRELGTPPPSISYEKADRDGYQSFDPVVSSNGGSFSVTLPTQDEFGKVSAEKPEFSSSGNITQDKRVESKLCYVETKGEVKKNKVGSTCDGYTTYYYYEFSYYQFERTQYTYTRVDTTEVYKVTEGLLGWKIGDVVYSPGERVEVSGVLVATPVIGELSKLYLRPETATYEKKTVKDVAVGTSSKVGDKQKYKDADSAKQGYTCPDGYTWFNPQNPYDKSKIQTTEKILTDWAKKE